VKNVGRRLKALQSVLSSAFFIFALVGCASNSEPSAERTAFVQSQYQLALARNQASLKAYEVAQTRLESEFHQKCESAARDVSEKLSEKQAIGLTVYYMAKDKIARTNDVDNYFSQVAGPVLKEVVDQYVKDMGTLSESFESELRFTSLAFAGTVAAPDQSLNYAPVKIANDVKSVSDFEKAMSVLGFRTAKLGARVSINVYSFSGGSVLGGGVKRCSVCGVSRLRKVCC
jgi:sulfite reductase alpha subunit-like flavoprotein